MLGRPAVVSTGGGGGVEVPLARGKPVEGGAGSKFIDSERRGKNKIVARCTTEDGGENEEGDETDREKNERVSELLRFARAALGVSGGGDKLRPGVDLASAVERFASCLEASVCRRGTAAPFSATTIGGGEYPGRVCASSPKFNGARLLPAEVLQAIRKANSMKGGGGERTSCLIGCSDGGAGGGRHHRATAADYHCSNVKNTARKREDLCPYDPGLGKTAASNIRRDGNGDSSKSGRKDMERRHAHTLPYARDGGFNCPCGDGRPGDTASRRLWGLHEDGQTVKEVVRYKEGAADGRKSEVISVLQSCVHHNNSSVRHSSQIVHETGEMQMRV